jgi:hypothetical protein
VQKYMSLAQQEVSAGHDQTTTTTTALQNSTGH